MAMDLQTSIAREIRAEMARQQLTQEQLAERLGTHQGVVSRKLRGEGSHFTTRDIERWAAALGVPVTQFLPAPTSTPGGAR
jgi:transcriptional regulator with XRE-family HTH domain